MPTRTASATWQGGIKGGKGSFRTATGLSQAYSFGSRFEEAAGSNPEELLAAAEAACFSMALSGNLERNGTTATRVETSAQCTIEKSDAGFRVTRMRLEVRADVPGIDNAAFQRIAETTRDTCPISQVMKGNVAIELTAKLG